MKDGPNSFPKTKVKPRAFSCPLPQFTYSESGPGRTEQRGVEVERGQGADDKENPKSSSCSMPKLFPLSGDGGVWVLGA